MILLYLLCNVISYFLGEYNISFLQKNLQQAIYKFYVKVST